ncbi:MAG: cytochrome P460 family protein [Thermomonas sp.]|uniref:cytochrome P460 family protein n=1 Tax=Thermomonas sp. TaxID=1971895 RepID=UPI002631A05F|nr:cytochrome P460 family protein [Thermomonas sp.]MCC7097798.1 cytochrome P460 family protein [Thermomonas sp.]
MKALLTGLALLSLAAPAHAGGNEVPYPEGYRNWHHVKSMVIQDGHPLYASFGGVHHLYANKEAMAGYATGKFPDGSVIVFDLLEAPAADHAITEGARKVAGVMHKDAEKYAATGGWGFEGFAGGDRSQRVVGDHAASACYACHTAQKDHDFVFSSTRD